MPPRRPRGLVQRRLPARRPCRGAYLKASLCRGAAVPTALPAGAPLAASLPLPRPAAPRGAWAWHGGQARLLAASLLLPWPSAPRGARPWRRSLARALARCSSRSAAMALELGGSVGPASAPRTLSLPFCERRVSAPPPHKYFASHPRLSGHRVALFLLVFVHTSSVRPYALHSCVYRRPVAILAIHLKRPWS